MKDLADYLAPDVERESIRKVAARIGIAKTTLENIIKRRLKKMPKVETLKKIADAYGLTLPAVVEMAGMTLGDGDRYARVAREMEQLPWIRKRLDELTRLSEQEFNYWLDWVAYHRDHPADGPTHPPPTQ